MNVSSTALINAYLSEIPTIETFGVVEVEAVTTIPVGVILESSSSVPDEVEITPSVVSTGAAEVFTGAVNLTPSLVSTWALTLPWVLSLQ